MDKLIDFVKRHGVDTCLTVAGLVGVGGLVAFFGTLVGLCVEYPAHMGFLSALFFYLGVLASYLFGKLSSRKIKRTAANLPKPMKAKLRNMLANDGLAYTSLFEQAGDYEALERMGLITKFSDHADATGSAGWMVLPEVRMVLRDSKP